MAKIDTIRERFKNKIKPIDFIELANNIDNSKTKKYTEHMVRFTKNLSNDFEITAINEMEYILEILNKFDELATNGLIEKPDLNQYKNLSTVKQSIKEATLTKSVGKAKKEIKVLYEDDKYMLFLPLSYDAASVYGRGTKWCVTQSEYFYRYSDKGILAYFIEKEKNRKIGLYYDMNESYYHSVLKTKNPNEFQLSGLKSKSIINNDEEEVKYDSEMMEMFNFSNKFSCWTDWDVKMEMMFVPIPLNIKELFINYCKENNIQNASLLDETETDNLIKQYECGKNEFGYDEAEPELMPPMGEMIMEDEMSPMETIQDEVYENNVGENYEF
jgi:flagellar basal body rod protein FlgB